MKFIKTDKWIRLRGQIGPNNERCKIDTLVVDKERIFFIPETEEEIDFFNIDTALSFTGIPYGPSSHNPDEPWGYRFYPDRTEMDMEKFANSINASMKNMYENGVASITEEDGKKTILN